VEFTALFIWLTLCLVLGGLISYVMTGARSHRLVRLLAAPGLTIRKFTMTLTALLCGATLTRVRLYDLSSEDIDFQAEGASSVAKVFAPLAPLFGCALAMTILNAAFGSPLKLSYSPPALASLDSGGLRGFMLGTWDLLAGSVRHGFSADWSSPRLYILLALIFSLALGASAPMHRIREAILGSALLAVSLAVLSSLAIRRAGVVATTPGWFNGLQALVVSLSGVAFIMMIHGMFAALAVGLAVRVYELVTRTGHVTPTRSTSRSSSRQWKDAA